jgi:hypothetical protein
MDAWQSRFSKMLIATLEAKIVEATTRMAAVRVADYAAYREQFGQIDGLRAALNEARDLEKSIDRPEGQKAAPNMVRQGYET